MVVASSLLLICPNRTRYASGICELAGVLLGQIKLFNVTQGERQPPEIIAVVLCPRGRERHVGRSKLVSTKQFIGRLMCRLGWELPPVFGGYQ